MARTPGAAIPSDRAVASVLRAFSPDRWSQFGRRSCYLYLDLGLEDALLVGACFGGWVAEEMMVRSTTRFLHLVFVDPLGIKIGGRGP